MLLMCCVFQAEPTHVSRHDQSEHKLVMLIHLLSTTYLITTVKANSATCRPTYLSI